MPLLRKQDDLQASNQPYQGSGKMKYCSTITLDDSDNLYECLLSEAYMQPRSEVIITKKKKQVTITIQAKDATSFRASTSGILKLLAVHENMEKIK